MRSYWFVRLLLAWPGTPLTSAELTMTLIAPALTAASNGGKKCSLSIISGMRATNVLR